MCIRDSLGGMLQGGEIVAHTPRNANIGEMESDPPSIQEIEEAISGLRNNKAPGTDLIPAELLKAGGTDVYKRQWQRIPLLTLSVNFFSTEDDLFYLLFNFTEPFMYCQ